VAAVPQAGLIERDRLLIVPAADAAELAFHTEAIEKVLRQARLQAERVPPETLPLLRTLTWDPKATDVKTDTSPKRCRHARGHGIRCGARPVGVLLREMSSLS
jgi:hypothetical protein